MPKPPDDSPKVRALRAGFGLAPDYADTAMGIIFGVHSLSPERQQVFFREKDLGRELPTRVRGGGGRGPQRTIAVER